MNGAIDLHSPEHPNFPKDAQSLQDPHRAPTEHEQYILDVFLRFKNLPDFNKLPPATPALRDEAIGKLDELLRQPPDPIADQDDRVLALAVIISEYPSVFGNIGYYIAAEIMGGTKTIETSEFRRAFLREYLPALAGLRAYLRRLAALRRRGKAAQAKPPEIPEGQRGSQNRRAAAREQMELVQNLPDYHVMEKYWRMLEIVTAYPDFFSAEQVEKLVSHTEIEKTWRAHLAKARNDLNYFNNLLITAGMMRQVIDSSITVLKDIAAKSVPPGDPPPSPPS